MLGLLNFEFVSIPAFEATKRKMPIIVPAEMKANFDESIDNQAFEVLE